MKRTFMQYTFDIVSPDGRRNYSVNVTARNEAVAKYVVQGEYFGWQVADRAKCENPAHYYYAEIDATECDDEDQPHYPLVGKMP